MPSLPILTKGNSSTIAMAAAAVARTVQVVKPHIPQIKFPLRGPTATKGTEASAGEVGAMVTSNATHPTKHGKPSTSTSKGPAIDSTQLPSRYRRKKITEEEMEYIEKGGQV